MDSTDGQRLAVEQNDTRNRLQAALVENAPALQDALAQQDWEQAMQLLGSIYHVHNEALHHEVARLTLQLHSAFQDLNLDAGSPHAEKMSQITDATERLQYVVQMTEQAANSSIDLVEASAPLVNYISYEAQSLLADWQRFIRREMPLDEFRNLARRVEEFLTRSLHDSDQLSGNLNEIMMAQSFQDLTGQVIKRVNQLIGYVEESLLKMTAMATAVDQLAGIEHDTSALQQKQNKVQTTTQGEGPQIRADQPNVVSDQVDVDDLLSSLGL